MTASGFNQIGAESGLVIGNNAVGLTFPTHPTSGETLTPHHALIYVANNPIRWRADGTDPTATSGMFVAANTYIEWLEPDCNYLSFLKRVKFIATGLDATIEVAYID